MDEQFARAFEDAAPAILQEAYDFVDHHEDVEEILVGVATADRYASEQVVYKINGERCHAGIAARHVGKDPDELDDHLINIDDIVADMASELGWEGMPPVMVLHYDVAERAMDARFFHDLQPGVPEQDRLVEGTWLARWMDRWLSTGSLEQGEA